MFSIADMDTYSNRDSPILWKAFVALGEHGLDFNGASDRFESTWKLDEKHVPDRLHLSPVVAGEERSQ